MATYFDAAVYLTLRNIKDAEEKIKLGKAVADGTDEILGKYAHVVATETAERVWQHRHPSNFFSKLSGTPQYKVKRVSPFYWKVQTPGGKWGEIASRTEVMHWSQYSQGRALVRGLDAEYRKSRGRAMYWALDMYQPTFDHMFEEMVADIERRANKATS